MSSRYSQELGAELASGVQLKKTETQEKIGDMPSAGVIAQEKTIQGVESFDKTKLKHQVLAEKPLNAPSKDVIAQEKTIQGVENFSKDALKPTETQEKNTLPDKEAIEAERRLSQSE